MANDTATTVQGQLYSNAHGEKKTYEQLKTSSAFALEEYGMACVHRGDVAYESLMQIGRESDAKKAVQLAQEALRSAQRVLCLEEARAEQIKVESARAEWNFNRSGKWATAAHGAVWEAHQLIATEGRSLPALESVQARLTQWLEARDPSTPPTIAIHKYCKQRDEETPADFAKRTDNAYRHIVLNQWEALD
tara:strand:+ start:1478 stop:2053 length:576 start_codon:yes stop_codon:yes gene_type:complete